MFTQRVACLEIEPARAKHWKASAILGDVANSERELGNYVK